jgi:Bacterial SH3 domain
MALIRCSKCGRQISSFAKACPACGTPPQISTVPPPLPTELGAAKGTVPRIIGIAALGGFVLFIVVLATMAKKPQSTAPSVASSSPLFTATPAEHFPRAIPVPPVFDDHVASATPALATYQVIKIPKGDYLNVRTGAGSKYPVIMKLDPGTGGIVLGANRVANAETMWQEIIVNGRTGWVNADYIAPATQPSASP